MNRSVILFMVLAAAVAGYAQQPDTIRILATNSSPVITNIVLKGGTKYVIQATGRVSYWRDAVPASEIDADAGYVFHIPYMSGFTNQEIDSTNLSIGRFQYLPCDGSSCHSVPAEFLCDTTPNYHNPNVYLAKRLHLDRDFLTVNGEEFCPRNGGDKTRNTYWQGIVGQGQPLAFQFHDGDGDFTHNSGTLEITITRLEPIMHVSRAILAFGKVRPNSPTIKQLDDSIFNIGSPFFPGCSGAAAGLTFVVDSITGDLGNDGFQVNGVTVGKSVPIQQGYAAYFTSTFTPKRKRPYQAIMWLTTNDPQVPQMKIFLTGEGIQGVTLVNPVDTLDFGDTPLNQTKTLPLSIQNAGTDILRLIGISPNGVDPAYTLPNVAAQDLQIGVTIKPLFKFAPRGLGMFYGTVIISSDGYNDAQHTVVLRGRGVAALLIVDSLLDFGTLPVGDSIIKSLPLRNAGNIPFGVQFVQFSSGDSLDFSAEPRTHIQIEADSLLDWRMGFHPQKPGRRAAVAEIAADGGGSPHYVYVIGFGTIVSKMTTTPRIDYGVVSIETTKTQSVMVRNIGNVPITLQQVSLAIGQFWSLPRTKFPTLMPRDSLLIDATFAPLQQMAYSDTLHIIDDSLRTYAIPLTGSGKRFVGVLSTVDTIDFGELFVGDTSTRFVPLRNVGNARLVLKNMSFPVPNVEFAAIAALPMRVDTLTLDSVQAFFYPAATGIRSTTFEITDSLVGKIDGIKHVHDVVFVGKANPPIVAVLAVDTVYSGAIGSHVTIPVEMRADIAKARSTSFKTDLRYDGSMLLPLSIQSDQLTLGYALAMNEASPGTLTVTGTGSAPLVGTGNLFNVTFEVLSSTNKETKLAIISPLVGNGRNPRSVQTIDGKFVSTGQCGSDLASRASATQITPNVPNPFGQSTSVHYVVGLPTHVTIAVYDAVGRKVAELVDADKNVGSYAAPFDAHDLPNGLYYCRMNAGQYVGTKSMMLMH